jgi:hypothetical protein
MSVRPSTLQLLLALFLGLAVLCVISRPVFAAAQEIHELSHDLGGDAATGDGDDGALEGTLHAPHCCFHAAMLPTAPLLPLHLARQEPPRTASSGIPPAPTARALRPPIAR